jgi:predicted ATPase
MLQQTKHTKTKIWRGKKMRKYVLTGGPSSGKSSLLLGLEQSYQVPIIREAAEDVIKFSQAMGIDEPWQHLDFQDHVLSLQLKREDEARRLGTNRIFVDRGILDGLAYFQIARRDPSIALRNAMSALEKTPYDAVFLVENLGGCDTNEIRRENLDEALKLEMMQEKNYSFFGYDVVRIGAAPLQERIEMIMASI